MAPAGVATADMKKAAEGGFPRRLPLLQFRLSGYLLKGSMPHILQKILDGLSAVLSKA
jgi:hypothetical protein